ncbi:MAG TPA: TadE family protein, partial [Anaerolineales bacterium]|nr:TadE family protein [Anaerolineales bacterium]
MNVLFRTQKRPGYRAQAMVEFALVMPVLALILFGVFEVGRMIYVYSAITNASREAVRFGSAMGFDDDGFIKYKHCGLASVDPMKGIRGMARRSAYFMNLLDANITIQYDHGPGTSVFHTCQGNVDPGYFISPGDRVLVTVTGQYRPYTRLVPWGPRTFVSASARTVLGFVALTT